MLFMLVPIFSNIGAVCHRGCPNDTRCIGAWHIPFANQEKGQSLWDLYKYSSYTMNTWSNVKPPPLFHKFLLIQRHVLKEPMTNDFPCGAEQPQTCFAWVNELSPLVRFVLRSKAMNTGHWHYCNHIHYYVPRSNSEAWYAANKSIFTFNGHVAACSPASIWK